MPKVTYRGPRERVDYRSDFRLPGEKEDLVLIEGQPVEVSEEVSQQLQSTTGHRFDVEPEPKPKS